MDRRKLILNGAQLGAGLVMAPLLTVATVMAQSPSSPKKDSAMTPAQRSAGRRSRIFITGSSDGLGHAAARTLLGGGHEVVVHVRSQARLPAVSGLVEQGAIATIGDLSHLEQTRDLARQVNAIGPMDAVIHNAGILSGPEVLVVNVVAPYLLTALIRRPRRLIYLSSSMHKGGRATLDGIDWSGRTGTAGYSESKLFITTLAAAVARLWPDVYSNAVDPGWVPTKMGGANAPDDLRLGHLTQEWLATSNDPRALTSGGYWYHQRLQEPHAVVRNTQFQNRLLSELARVTGTRLG
ncbi:SDR family NAD(P)-dependent oxidoreductase [Cupriavidus neocaledonicus]|uniref:Putative Short-chain dehydrogenase/reductase SDR membrane protein n=1 Tax=Cupriavidus neocaledonicus TaxID=1040979 RepID=A0A375HNX7_9BURK|nr:SDR family NAD(P)-dependent oxidoreductase [Cupriavidus neocaledonicus]SOZ38772.1 putative Short-chain dehydrogenase/reductase SDR; putative membrane protein [Cupriavidus neocaledonicus]SPD59582.1 putative Short-chain dehydrogenase/reductase SDR membrane protein [Cupriavidus neocaledonicus]